ncbi:MAG: response regulator transcription factor [Phycisphaerae bacterium]|nr:response regulator transcription factor [Phycisphaerae bacterium]
MAGELADKKILIVDDDRDILTAVELALEDLGPEIITAADGNNAIIQAEENSPDLVVLDMMLPQRSGFLVMEKLKRGKKRTDPPRVIMITGNQGIRHRQYAESLGVDLYLIKPFRMEKLVESIKNLLS